MPHRTIRLFLASSSELLEDREQFEIFINRKNKELNAQGLFISLEIWEDFLDSISQTRLQDEYNRMIRECDLFVMLFHTKVGPYTLEEFETAFHHFKATNKPRIFTYFKDVPVKPSALNRDAQNFLFDFQDKLKALGHFWSTYENIDSLKHQFSTQLTKLQSEDFFKPPPEPKASTSNTESPIEFSTVKSEAVTTISAIASPSPSFKGRLGGVKLPLPSETPENSDLSWSVGPIEKKREEAIKIDLSRLPNTDSKVFGREPEFKLLNEAWTQNQPKIVSFVAWGGVGKSSLVNAWLNTMEAQKFKGAEQVFGWSFYSQGTSEQGQASTDGFFNDLFQWLKFTGEIPTSPHEKGRLLANQLSTKRTLLVLDGLEPLQFPPGPMEGRLKDSAMKGFLKTLVHSMNGLCVITTRCLLEDLKSSQGQSKQTVMLDNLSEAAGVAVLQGYDLKAKTEELQATVDEFKGHALALHLVGSYLKNYCEGDIKQRNLIPALTIDEKHGGHARRAMQFYALWFAEQNESELDVLHLLGLFDRPAMKGALDALTAEPAIPGLTERLLQLSKHQWKNTLIHLRTLRLLAAKNPQEPDTLDCHPLIREHFGQQLQQDHPEAWQAAHARLYDYYQKLPKDEQPDTLEAMEPLFAAIRHGCLAGKHQETLDEVLQKRIYRYNEKYTVHKLGAFGSDLSYLSNFFERLWDQPASGLIESDKAAVLNWAGFALRAVGRLAEAAQPIKAGLDKNIETEDWKNAASAAFTLSELHLTLGEVDRAVDYGAQSVDWADRSQDDNWMFISRTKQAGALHQAGQIKAAQQTFVEAETLQKKGTPGVPYLYSLRGFQFCDLLLALGQTEATLQRARTIIKLQTTTPLNDFGLHSLTIGKALMQQGKDLTEALNFLNQAVEGLRAAGQQDNLPLGLLARAQFYGQQGECSKAWRDLEEVWEIADYGQMRLHLVDYHLEAARLLQTEEADSSQIESHLKSAETLIQETGYHRRTPELAELQGKVVEDIYDII